MQKGNMGGIVVKNDAPVMQAQTGTSKQFLKRKTTYRGKPQGQLADK